MTGYRPDPAGTSIGQPTPWGGSASDHRHAPDGRAFPRRFCARAFASWACFFFCWNDGGLRPVHADAHALPSAEQVRLAFQSAHHGWSVDELLLQDELGDAFFAACWAFSSAAPPTDDDARHLFETHCRQLLLRLRKQGRLHVPTTRRASPAAEDPAIEAYLHLAEIAARTIADQHGAHMDHILADRRLLQLFDQQAMALAQAIPEIRPYLLRRAALQLRKRRQLRPELIARVTDWGRVVTVHSLTDLVSDPGVIPTGPGVYLFRDPGGYLYIGEAANLRQRVGQHLRQSDRAALTTYLKEAGVERISIEIHAFDPDSQAKRVSHRRAYESELIASRQPRLNIRP